MKGGTGRMRKYGTLLYFTFIFLFASVKSVKPESKELYTNDKKSSEQDNFFSELVTVIPPAENIFKYGDKEYYLPEHCPVTSLETAAEEILRCVERQGVKIEPTESPFRVWHPEDPEEFERALTQDLEFPHKWQTFFKPKRVLPHSASVEYGQIHGHYSAGFVLTGQFWDSLETLLSNRLATTTFLDFLNSRVCATRFSNDRCDLGGGGGGTEVNPCPSGACPGSITCPDAGGDLGCVDLFLGIKCSLAAVPCDTSNGSCAERTLDGWCVYLNEPIGINISSCTNYNDPYCGFDSSCDNDGLRLSLAISRFALELYARVQRCPGSDCDWLWDFDGCPACDDYVRLWMYSSDADGDGFGVYGVANIWPRYCLHEDWGNCSDWHDCQDRSKFSVCACTIFLWLDRLEGRGCSLPILGNTRLCLPTWAGCNCSCSCGIDDLGCCVLEIICWILDVLDFEESIMCTVQGKLNESLRNALADFSTFNTDLLCLIGEEVPGGDPTRTCPGDEIQSAAIAAYPQYCAARTLGYSSTCLREGSLFWVEMAFSDFTPDTCVAGSPPNQALNVGVNRCSSNPRLCFPDGCGYDVGFMVGKELINEGFYWLWVSGLLCGICLPIPADLGRILFPPLQRDPNWPFDTELCLIPYATSAEQPFVDVTPGGQLIVSIPRAIFRLQRVSDGHQFLEFHVRAQFTFSAMWINTCHPLDPLCCDTPSDPTCRRFQCEICDNAGCPRYEDIPYPPGYLHLGIDNFSIDLINVVRLDPIVFPNPAVFRYVDVADIIGALFETRSIGAGHLNWRPYVGFAGVILQPVYVGFPPNSGAFVIRMDLTVECLNFMELIAGSPVFQNGHGSNGFDEWSPFFRTLYGIDRSEIRTRIAKVLWQGKSKPLSPKFLRPKTVKSSSKAYEIVIPAPGEVSVKVGPDGKLLPKTERKTVFLWRIKEFQEHYRISKDGNIKFLAKFPGQKYTLEILQAVDVGKGDENGFSGVLLPEKYPSFVTVWVGPRFFAKVEKGKITVQSPDVDEFEVMWKRDGEKKWKYGYARNGKFTIHGESGKVWITVKTGDFEKILEAESEGESKTGCSSLPLPLLALLVVAAVRKNGKK